MKAAILVALNEPLLVEEVMIPDLSYGQVLVQVECSTVCGKQIDELTGVCGLDPYLPHLMGHEGCGRVVSVGPSVTKVRVKNRVVMHWRVGSGIECSPPKYPWGDRKAGAGPIATFAEYAIISENRLTVIDEETPAAVASLMGCAVTTALGLINNEAKLKIGQSIAVAGCGGVGLNIVQGAQMVSANPIIAIDRLTSKLNWAMDLGATHVVLNNGVGVMEDIRKIVGKAGVDVFVDCTGDPRVINEGIIVTAPKGRLIMVTPPAAGSDLTFVNARQHFTGKIITDSQGGRTDPNVDIPKYLELYRKHKLFLNNLISHVFPLAQINQAIEVVRSGSAGRVALEMNNE